VLALVAIAGAALGAGGMTLWNTSGPVANRPAIERVVHDYLMAHPEVIPAAMQRLQEQESAKAVAGIGSEVTRPFGGAWAGNPRGDVTVVEYYDYNCGYCRASLPTLRQLVKSDPDVRIVFRELPILAASSRAAARNVATSPATKQPRVSAGASRNALTMISGPMPAGSPMVMAMGFMRGCRCR